MCDKAEVEDGRDAIMYWKGAWVEKMRCIGKYLFRCFVNV
jgi:hypothetical protein